MQCRAALDSIIPATATATAAATAAAADISNVGLCEQRGMLQSIGSDQLLHGRFWGGRGPERDLRQDDADLRGQDDVEAVDRTVQGRSRCGALLVECPLRLVHRPRPAALVRWRRARQLW